MRKQLRPGWSGILDPRRWKFEWRYRRGRAPWDTNVTPPEVMDFIAATPPGKALDLGCGTGTHAIALARHGWQVTGVDFAPWAIRRARQKAEAGGVAAQFYTADVTELDMLSGGYGYALDIGCLFGLRDSQRPRYAAQIARLIALGGRYMLYAWLPSRWEGQNQRHRARGGGGPSGGGLSLRSAGDRREKEAPVGVVLVQPSVNLDGGVKSPISALRCISKSLRRA